jgi:hypothetical protein
MAFPEVDRVPIKWLLKLAPFGELGVGSCLLTFCKEAGHDPIVAPLFQDFLPFDVDKKPFHRVSY